MQYQIGEFTLCTIDGIVKGAQGEFKIRPKTLQVLQYLIEHRERVATKREIIDTIWDDVVVQDQVLFQSIKELRDIFSDITVIKTFPRKGYQWVGDVSEVDLGQKAVKDNGQSYRYQKHWLAGTVALLLIGLLNAAQYFQSTPSAVDAKLDFAVLPIINEMKDSDHKWVTLEGMDILIHQLQQATDVNILSTDAVLYSLERSDAYAEPTPQEQVYRVRQAIGADVVVQAVLRGYPQDYQLHYSLISPHNTERGVEFSDTISGVMLALTKTIAQRFGGDANNVVAYQSDFSSEAFASGVEHYMSERFVTAEPFLRSAVSANADLLAARRFLAGALAHQGKLDEAIEFLTENISRAAQQSNQREEVRAVLMIGNWLANSGRSAEAEPYLAQARHLAEEYGDKLFIAYAYEELGKIRRRNGNYAEAENLLKTALDYQQGFSCPYGQTNVLVELGRNAFALGDDLAAENYLNLALKIADENGVTVNRFWTLLALAEMHEANGEEVRSRELATQAKSLADLVHDDYLINKADHWLKVGAAKGGVL